MAIRSIHHPAFSTNDMKKTISFWCGILGFKPVLTFHADGSKQYFFSINESQFITFFEWKNIPLPPKRRHGVAPDQFLSFDHISFCVEQKEELLHYQDLLESNHYPVSDIIDHGFVHSIYSYDPNNIPVEILFAVGHVNLIANPIWNDEDTNIPEITKLMKENEFQKTEHPYEVIPGMGHDLFKK